jgi:hypothetical protein
VLAVLVKQTHNQRKMTGIDTQNFHVFIFALSAAGRNSEFFGSQRDYVWIARARLGRNVSNAFLSSPSLMGLLT